ncbi:MAG: PIN domain-containing protein [Solirubrobacteraceae bacterium]
MPALIVDAGPLHGLVSSDDPRHEAIVDALDGWPGELVVPAFAAAEADHLVLERLGLAAELSLIDDLALTFRVQSLEAAELRLARELCARYGDLRLGLADAAIVVLAKRWSTRWIATFDQRHFRAVTPLQGGTFRLVPIDGDSPA